MYATDRRQTRIIRNQKNKAHKKISKLVSHIYKHTIKKHSCRRNVTPCTTFLCRILWKLVEKFPRDPANEQTTGMITRPQVPRSRPRHHSSRPRAKPRPVSSTPRTGQGQGRVPPRPGQGQDHSWARQANNFSVKHTSSYVTIYASFYYAPAQRALSDDAVWRLSVWRPSDVCLNDVSGRRAAGRWMARIGWSGSAAAWLKAADACFRCRPGREAHRGGRPPTACLC